MSDADKTTAEAPARGRRIRFAPGDLVASTPLLAPKRIVRDGLVVLLATIVWTVILPGYLAYRQGTLYARQIKAELLKRDPKSDAAAAAVQDTDAERDAYERWLKHLDAQIDSASTKDPSPGEMRALIEARGELMRQRDAIRSPIVILGFASGSDKTALFGNAVNVFVLVYLSLGFLLLALPRDGCGLVSKKSLLAGLAMYLMFTWPNFYRNFLDNKYHSMPEEHGRMTYAYAHIGISDAGFWFQEARVYVMLVLVAVVLHRSRHYYHRVNASVSAWYQSSDLYGPVGSRSAMVSDEFNRWQVWSLLLAGAFFPWTYFFWTQVVTFGDVRYIMTAVIVHVYWALTWFTITAPVLSAWRAWAHYRARALASVLQVHDDAIADRIPKVFSALSPVSYGRVMGASISAAASFVLPLLQLFR